jgi:hypothetical protein
VPHFRSSHELAATSYANFGNKRGTGSFISLSAAYRFEVPEPDSRHPLQELQIGGTETTIGVDSRQNRANRVELVISCENKFYSMDELIRKIIAIGLRAENA